MDGVELQAESFILKVWIEETADDGRRASWRGHITHVPSRQRRYLRDLDAIAAFVAPYLERKGVRLGLVRRLRYQYLRRGWKHLAQGSGADPGGKPGGRVGAERGERGE